MTFMQDIMKLFLISMNCISFIDSELLTFDETMQDIRWRQTIDEEIKSIEKNNT